MDVGLQMVFSSYGWSNVSDEQVWDEELRLARVAADLGFDVLWSVEHHFNDYSFCPDNLQLMSYLAAVCPDVDLGTAAVILPWHDHRGGTEIDIRANRREVGHELQVVRAERVVVEVVLHGPQHVEAEVGGDAGEP